MISIIVPIYKAEVFLPRCIDSVIAQTYTNWELLLVDDGSPDKSGKICEEYSRKDARIKVYHKQNGGVSSARNYGLDKARGEWVSFLDADDYILPSFLDNLINNNKGFELICSGYMGFGDSKRNGKMPVSRKYDVTSYVRNIFELSSNKKKYLGAISYPWGKLLKMDLIKNNKLQFISKMKLSEDTCFMLRYLEYIHNVLVIKGGDYMYYISNAPKSHLCMNIEEYKTHVNEMTNTVKHLGNAYQIDTEGYILNMCSLYFKTFINHIKLLQYKEMSKEYSAFKCYNRYNMKLLTGSMAMRKRIIVRLAFSNVFLLYLITKFFSNKL